MAQQTTVELVDDLDGGPAAETITFGLDGHTYEIDLSDANAKELREGLADYIDAGRKAGARATASTRNDKALLTDVRAWAAANGYSLATRGRVPHAVMTAYQQAH